MFIFEIGVCSVDFFNYVEILNVVDMFCKYDVHGTLNYRVLIVRQFLLLKLKNRFVCSSVLVVCLQEWITLKIFQISKLRFSWTHIFSLLY